MPRVRALTILLALGAALALPGCGGERETPPVGRQAGDVGTVAGERLDYLVRVGNSALSEDGFFASLPEEFRTLLSAEEKRAYLDRWVDTELLYLAALDRGLLENAELERRLEQQRREFIANQLLQAVLAERVQVSEGEIADYYAAHLEEYGSEYRYRELVVASQAEAADLHRRLLANPAGFARLAEQHSLAGTARQGGELDWLAKGTMPPEVEERLVKLAPQEISQPFETAWGWTIIQLRERRSSGRTVALPEVREEILRRLTMERRRAVYAEFLEEVQQSYAVRYHPDLDLRLRSDEFRPGGRAQEE
ncbi:hypothetical protein FJ251_01355 [bacterium]|nr:hypothetical protein [bacterium]